MTPNRALLILLIAAGLAGVYVHQKRIAIYGDGTRPAEPAGGRTMERPKPSPVEPGPARAVPSEGAPLAGVVPGAGDSKTPVEKTQAAISEGFTLVNEFTNQGRAEPAKAFGTLIWAAIAGDRESLRTAFVIEGEDGVKLQELWSGLPPETRARYIGVQDVIGVGFAREVLSKASAFEILGIEENGGQAIVNARRTSSSGRDFRDAKLLLRKDANLGWRFVVPQSAVNHFLDMVARESETEATR